MNRKPKDSSVCRYNVGVICDEQTNCAGCGWYPREEMDRKERIRRGLRALLLRRNDMGRVAGEECQTVRRRWSGLRRR